MCKSYDPAHSTVCASPHTTLKKEDYICLIMNVTVTRGDRFNSFPCVTHHLSSRDLAETLLIE